MSQIKTLSPKNEALIVCPIFNAETKIADCFILEQKLARGDVQPERKGCQACLRSSKCPIYWINRDIRANGEDPYHASEPRTLSLKDKHLSAISPILVRDETLNEFQVGPEEREAIIAANEAASSGAKARSARKAPAVKLGRVPRDAIAVTSSDPENGFRPASTLVREDDTFKAAVSGDMSHAITKASQKAQEAPAPEPAPVAPPKPAPAPAPKPAPAITAPSPAPAGKGMSLLEMARARAAAAKAAA